MMRRLPGLLLWLVLATGAFPLRGQACAECHDVGEKIKPSVHARLDCAKCHTRHESYPHPAGTPKAQCEGCHAPQGRQHGASVHGRELKSGNGSAPGCASCHGSAHEVKSARTAEYKAAVPATCGMCHTEVEAAYRGSVHGLLAAKGVVDAPVCSDCHGEHSIERPAAIRGQVRETCGRCHGDVRLARKFGLPADRLTSFDASFHGLAARTGSQTVANCASCHGFHDVLPSSDPRSRTHAGRLAATCGSCHPGAGSRFALGPVHLAEGAVEPGAVTWIRNIYLVLIPLVIGLMFAHHFGDFVRKSGGVRQSAEALQFRMHVAERLQHALLAVSFLTLTWSGFALKYPDHWWAAPLGGWEHWAWFRGWIHRVAGVVMLATGLAHVLSIAFSTRLRNHWRALLPVRADVGHAARGFLWRLGLRRQRPAEQAHGYMEKAEYWAVVWGTLVMGVTGLLLWANGWVLVHLPKALLDIATALHFYEALLAALAILVWHFYLVIFDPEIYPMDWAWLTGRSRRRRELENNQPNVESNP